MLNNTKGAILIPSFYKSSFISVGRYLNLLNEFNKDFGFDIIETDDFTDTSYGVVIVLKSPNKGAFDLMSGVKSLPKSTKVILYLSDLHSNDEVKACGLSTQPSEFYHKMKEMCERADLIICPYKSSFLYKYPEFEYKFKFFPHFVDDSYTFPEVSCARNQQCLVSGALCTTVYPIRLKAYKHRLAVNSPFVSLSHPGYFKSLSGNKYVVGQRYIAYLGKYMCALTTSSCFDYTVSKYFEIPAAGSLLIASHSRDLDELGFIDGVNYIKVDLDNVIDKTKEVLYNINLYNNIRKAGQELVLANYTKSIAYTNLKHYIEELFIGDS